MANNDVEGLDKALRILDEVIQYAEQDIPVVIGVEATNFFKESFQNEGFTNTSLQKWAPRKTRYPGENNRKVLTGSTAELGESVDYKIEGSTVTIYSDKIYAQIHNEGGIIPVTPGMRKYFWAQFYTAKEGGDTDLMNQYKAMALAKQIVIPKRQFMGESAMLNDRITDKIVRDLTNILNQLNT